MGKGKLDVLCDGLGIRLIPVYRRRMTSQSHARGTMHEIRNKHGDGHLVFVLRCIRETTNNKDELWSETIGAISDIFEQRPDWLEKGGQVLDAFDNIPLGKLREKAKQCRPWPVRATLRAMIYERLDNLLVDLPQ